MSLFKYENFYILFLYYYFFNNFRVYCLGSHLYGCLFLYRQ
nr:MAG TPA: hypothetical protein [Microviridae sp. ctOX110]